MLQLVVASKKLTVSAFWQLSFKTRAILKTLNFHIASKWGVYIPGWYDIVYIFVSHLRVLSLVFHCNKYACNINWIFSFDVLMNNLVKKCVGGNNGLLSVI